MRTGEASAWGSGGSWEFRSRMTLKQRLRGPRGHLSNGEAAAFISEVATRETRSLVLAHLSRTNNRADLAMLEAHRALGRLSSEIRMTVAEQGPGAHWIEA